MIEILEKLIPSITESIQRPQEWDSLIINKRKPWTFRVFRKFDNYRVCLHAFHSCSAKECFTHPHPWPGAFLILQGSYIHSVGGSADLEGEPEFLERSIVKPFSMYEILNPRTWHSVQPLERTYTVMVNGEPFEKPHSKTRTTKGKDLEKMTPDELENHMRVFVPLFEEYNKQGDTYV